MLPLPELISNLRKIGFSISLSEVLEGNQLLAMAESSTELRLGLRMIFSKSKQEQDLFNFIWQYFYANMIKEKSEPEENDDLSQNQSNPSDKQTDMNMMGMPAQNAATGFDSAFPSGDPSIALSKYSSNYKGIVRQLIQGNDRNAAAILLRYLLADTFSTADFDLKIQEITDEVREILYDVSPEMAKPAVSRLDTNVQQLFKEYIQNPINIRRNPLRVQDITELPILSLKQSPELQHALRVLGRKLATKHKRKRKAGSRHINLRKTIRKNIQHGGTLLELQRTSPRVTKPRLILISDVSPSTIQATQLFLSIIWNAKEVFRDIRYFEFIGSCLEVSAEFKRAKNVNEGMEVSLQKWQEMVQGRENSDYYSAFRMFEKLVGSKLNKQASIIILGDLRDWLGPWKEGIPLSSTVLGKIRKKVNRIIVLNPEPKSSWDSGDSICKFLSKQGIEIHETTNLGKLVDALLTIE